MTVESSGFKCPACGGRETRIIDSRASTEGDLTRRRRECQDCHGRFTTYEAIEHPVLALKRWEAIKGPMQEMQRLLQAMVPVAVYADTDVDPNPVVINDADPPQ